MKNRNKLRLVLATGLALAALPQAHALTAAGDIVSNTASVAYKVATIDQTPVDSNTSTFVVDRIIDIDATADNTPLAVDPGATGNQLKFTVTNQSNDTIDVGLAVLQTADATVLAPSADVDGLTMESFSFYVDLNGNNAFDTGEDITVIPSLAAGDSMVVYAVAKTPDTAANDLFAGVSLVATAREAAGGAVITETAGADTAGMDTVFDDGDGPVSGDIDEDGKISVFGAYKVSSANLAIVKSSTVIWDPVNLFVNPKAIPGAIIEYCLVVKNSGTANADDLVLNDPIPTETTYEADSIYIGLTGTDTTCDARTTGTMQSDAADLDDGEFVAGLLPAKGEVTVRTLSVAEPAGTFRVVFRVTVD